MTTYSKRRARRSLAAILAAMLMASVLAVVAGSPAQAANTSGEYLIDHDEDPDTEKVREFAGRDRYDTALKLATRFAKDRGGIGSVPNAFVASGESLVDAVSVAGLAGFMDAPVLLTRSGQLHGGVKDFIEDYGVSNIYVFGGTAAVADGVVDELKALAGVGSVDRIAGDDRYATSAAIASNLAGESWCGTNENSAIIVNGADDSLFNAVAIGPVANRLELPVLLTAGDDLVDAVISYIESEDVEHAVIVGGTSSVSEGVEQALGDAGVDTVERIDGDTAAAVSVAIAEVIGDECADDLSPVSDSAVALVNSSSVIDGIPAAPVLADDTNQLGGGLVPILAVGDTLPAPVSDYLAGTPEERDDGTKIHLRVLAVGGTAAVSDSVVDAATDAAGSADALSVEIYSDRKDLDDNRLPLFADENLANDTIVLKFNDDIFREDTESITGLRNRLEDLLFINGVPADIASQTDDSADTICQPDTVTVNLEQDLKEGDVVEIVEATIKVGAAEDQRTVAPKKVTVPKAPADMQRPSIRIIAIEGHNQVYALVSDNKDLGTNADGSLNAEDDTLLNGDLLDGNANELIETVNGDADITAVRVVPGPRDENTLKRTSATLVFTLSEDAETEATEGVVDNNDRFRVNRGAVVDAAGNESQVTTAGEISAVSKLQVSSAQMSNLNHTANGVVLIPAAHKLEAEPAVRSTDPTVPSPGVAGDDGTPVDADAQNPAMWLQAKGDGAAAGVVGNLFTVRADRASDWDGDKDVDIDVFVSTKDRRIVIRINDGKPKYADLKEALEANATVTSLFDVLIDNAYDEDGDTCKAANENIRHALLPVIGDAETDAEGDDTHRVSGGVTKARLKVNFNGWIEHYDAAQNQRLLNAVFDGAAGRYKDALLLDDKAAALARVLGHTDGTNPGLGTDTSGADPVATALIGAAKDTPGDGDTIGPRNAVWISITARGTLGALKLPRARDIVELSDGFDKHLADDEANDIKKGDVVDADADEDGVQRQDGDQSTGTPAGPGFTSVANGYGDNGADAATENDFNYGSKVRIVTSSSVPAPPR